MLTAQQLKVLAQASRRYGSFEGEQAQHPGDFARIRDLALDALGRPTDEDVVAPAIELLSNADRNLRVVALRVLAWYRERADVVEALVAATRDDVRRVRRIAMDLIPADQPTGVERLIEVAEDETEYHRIRSQALFRIAKRPLRPETLEPLRRILGRDRDRRRVLFVLVSRELDEVAREVLRDIVRTGTKEEAVTATRALCGQVLVRSDNVVPPNGEPAEIEWLFDHGSRTKTKYVRYYWVPLAS